MFFKLMGFGVFCLVAVSWLSGLLLSFDFCIPGNPFAGNGGTASMGGPVLLGFFTPLLMMIAKGMRGKSIE